MATAVVRAHDPNRVVQLIQEHLRPEESGVSDTTFVCIGDTIEVDEEDGYLRGHGTQTVDGCLVATICGVVSRVNKLVYVKALKSRYTAQLGDVVVGRVTDVVAKRWKMDLNSRQEASLLLSAVNLAGGVQRRRNAEDELNMRLVYKEGDLISMEVQSLHQDGSIALQTRSAKFGKLAGGQLVSVPPNLIKRQKQHFQTLEQLGVDLILGVNGLIWVAPHVPRDEGDATAAGVTSTSGTHAAAPPEPTLEQRQRTCRVAGAIRTLARLCLLVYPATIMDAYEVSITSGTDIKDMLEPGFLGLVAMSEAVRRHGMQEG